MVSAHAYDLESFLYLHGYDRTLGNLECLE